MPQLYDIFRIKIAPGALPFSGKQGSGTGIVKLGLALQGSIRLLIERFKGLIGKNLRFAVLRHIVLQREGQPRQGLKALNERRIGIFFLRQMQNTQITERVQHFCASGGLSHDVDDFHFLNHDLLASNRFFLAILPRTTALVCWSPR